MLPYRYHHIGDHARIGGQDVVVICVDVNQDTNVTLVYYGDGSVLIVSPLDSLGARSETLHVWRG